MSTAHSRFDCTGFSKYLHQFCRPACINQHTVVLWKEMTAQGMTWLWFDASFALSV